MNDYERKLLIVARQIIESGREQFICLAISDARRSFLTDDADWVKDTISCGLRKKIEEALEGKFTFDVYLYRNYGFRIERIDEKSDWWDKHNTFAPEIRYFPKQEFYNIARLARLAWIDRMLDSNEVK
jgi:hypothetical protein